MRKALMATLWLALSATAWAGTKSGVTMPDTVQVEGKTLTLNGMGLREATVFNVNVYVAGLYLVNKSNTPDQINGSEQVKRLDLHFVRDVDRDDITEAWTSGFKKNHADMAKLGGDIAKLNSWMTDIKKGDEISFVYVPGKG